MVVEADHGDAHGCPVTSRVTPEFTQTGFRRRHNRRRSSGSSARRPATAHETGPPLLNTSAVPDPTASAVRRSADPTRSVKTANGSAYSSSWAPPVHRSLAPSNHSWNSPRVGVRPSKGAGRAASIATWSNSAQPGSVSMGTSAPRAVRQASAVSWWRRIPPLIARVGSIPRAASALPSSRDCSHPVSDSTS